jgi:hypothetical protein
MTLKVWGSETSLYRWAGTRLMSDGATIEPTKRPANKDVASCTSLAEVENEFR